MADGELTACVREQLVEWFGAVAREWRYLRTYRIRKALPVFLPGVESEGEWKKGQPGGPVLCGDHGETPSLQGAMVSGRRAADAILRQLAKQR